MEVSEPMSINQPVLKVEHDGLEMLYCISNDHTAWRVKSMLTKEPDTIAWIKGMAPNDTFIDIGANIGIYTIFAAARKLKVYAFEPEAQNYALLCRSVMFNDFDNVSAYCLALSDRFALDHLYLSAYLPGGSCHTFGENLDHRLEKRDNNLRQGCLSVPLDEFRLAADHIKVDVDGLEHKVVEGARDTILGAKSVLLEINQNLPQHQALCRRMFDWGFKVDQAQVEAATRKEGTFKDCGNWIFMRS
jgi:FkbM family methyltransferase